MKAKDAFTTIQLHLKDRVYAVGTHLVSFPTPFEPVMKICHWIEVAEKNGTHGKRHVFLTLSEVASYVRRNYPLTRQAEARLLTQSRHGVYANSNGSTRSVTVC